MVNVGDRRSYSIREIVTMMEEIMNCHIDVQWGSVMMENINRTDNLEVDTAVAERHIGWHPKVSVYEGLQRTINYYRSSKEKL